MTRLLRRPAGTLVASLALQAPSLRASAPTATAGEAVAPTGDLRDPVAEFATPVLEPVSQFVDGSLDSGDEISGAAGHGEDG
jgi:hypothetical protein